MASWIVKILFKVIVKIYHDMILIIQRMFYVFYKEILKLGYGSRYVAQWICAINHKIPYISFCHNHSDQRGMTYDMSYIVCPNEMYSEMLWIRLLVLKKSVSWYTITIAVRIPQTVNDVNNHLKSRLTVQHWPVLDQIVINSVWSQWHWRRQILTNCIINTVFETFKTFKQLNTLER